MRFNPLKDHERYLDKDPKDMSLTELRMLLKIKRMDLQLGWNEFEGKIKFWQRVVRSIRESGMVDQMKEGIQSYLQNKTPKE
ncbi:hypothetical protein EHR01_08740 [Leptospira mtsangambouensis]|uniref:Uncharacterized protein n=1 Tax=Leptospira mtsangambouensis TaxID=2484912 RepID=A0ABY2P0V1_9LEPT|nr:hypothetical protein [Leptospira mtsangambouensis]TGM77682.1 hypothetical protein EHR01_08740 [Leptospira mtsangambouensis]